MKLASAVARPARSGCKQAALDQPAAPCPLPLPSCRRFILICCSLFEKNKKSSGACSIIAHTNRMMVLAQGRLRSCARMLRSCSVCLCLHIYPHFGDSIPALFMLSLLCQVRLGTHCSQLTHRPRAPASRTLEQLQPPAVQRAKVQGSPASLCASRRAPPSGSTRPEFAGNKPHAGVETTL